MKDSEKDEILWRLDERTARIDDRIDRIHDAVDANDEALTEIDSRVQRNSIVLGAITFGLSSAIATLMTKLHAVIAILRQIS